MNITISSLFFYDKSLAAEFVDRLMPTLVTYLTLQPTHQIELLLTDNSPNGEMVLETIESRLSKSKFLHPHLFVKATRNESNLGFGAAHNQSFRKSASDIFVVLNNDVFFETDNWLGLLVEPLKNSDVVFVGLKNAPRVLLASGNGDWAKDSQIGDYVEGSVLAMRSEPVRKNNLFAPDLPWAYFEDSDLLLRYRQMGFKFASVKIDHEHRRSASAAKIPQGTLLSIRERNRSRFLARWGGYLKVRKFTNKILLDLRTDGWGDCIASLPSFHRLLLDHPTAQFDVYLGNESLRPFFEYPRVAITVKKRVDSQVLSADGYDRAFSLFEVDFTSPLYIGSQIAASLGVDFDVSLARIKLTNLHKKIENTTLSIILKAASDLGKKIAVVHAEFHRTEWEGRAVSENVWKSVIEELNAGNYFTVLVGSATPQIGSVYEKLGCLTSASLSGQTDLQDLNSLLSKSSLYVGIDSGPLHFAQILGVPTFAVFGATLPSSRMLVEEGHFGFVHPSLDCIGCYHQKRGDSYNYCIRRDEACVKKLEVQQVLDALTFHLKTLGTRPKYPVEQERRMYALKIEPTLRVRSTIEEYRFKELSLALLRKVIKMISDRLIR